MKTPRGKVAGQRGGALSCKTRISMVLWHRNRRCRNRHNLAGNVPARQRRMQHENSSVCDGENQTALSTMDSSAAPLSKINRNIYPGHIETIKHRSAPKEH
jgi:hypothetical protein